MARLIRAVALWGALAAVFTTALLAGPYAQSQVPPIGQQPPARPATALIIGQLVDGSSGSPVSSALISLDLPVAPRPVGPDGLPVAANPARGQPPNQPPQVLTDGNGRFVFHSLAAGSYGLSARRPGYLPSAFGRPQPTGGSGSRIELADGQRLTNVIVKIWKLASISGRLLDEAGEPAVGATLRILQSTGPASARRYALRNTEQTDDRGIYRFSQLPPGDYVVMLPSLVVSVPMAVVDAYLDANATGAAGAAGNQVGRDVQASGGTMSSVGTRIADQLVQASGGRGGMATQLIADVTGKMSVYPVTFYPGVRQIASATVVTVESGQERTGVDFAARPVPAASVTGRVTGPDGAVSNITVKLVPLGLEALATAPTSGSEVAWAITRADGAFTALGVPAGDYTATVLKVPIPTSPMAPEPGTTISVGGGTTSFSSGSAPARAAPPAEPILWGRTPVSVGETNVDGVAIQLAYGATVSGRVEFEAGSTPVPTADQLQRAGVSLSPLEGPPVGRFTPGLIAADGSFKTQGYPPGRYNLSIPVALQGWTLKSVMLGGRNVINMPLDLAGPDVSGVVATYTDKTGEISGSIVKVASDPDPVVLLLPGNYQSWIQNGMIAQGVRAAQSRDGTYRVTGILAGEYVIVAVPAAAGQLAQDPQAMAALARQGTRVTIGEREKRTLSLTVAQVRQP